MEKIVTKWRVEVNILMRTVKVTGIVTSNKYDKITYQILLFFTLQVVKMAKENNGILIPLQRIPPKRNEMFSYIEIIFKDNENIENFTKLLQKWSS